MYTKMSQQFRFVEIAIAMILCSTFNSVGQGNGVEIGTDYPPITRGVFASFSFPAKPILGNSVTGDKRKTFKLTNGVFRPSLDSDGHVKRTGAYLRAVDFFDVTGDRVKEGIATIGPIHNGTAEWYGIYIYSMSRGKPVKLLWSFATGDRGVGGLKKVGGRNGQLIIELWGWDSGPDSPPTSHVEAQAGSSHFTRRSYTWNGTRFVQRGETRIFEID